MNRVLATVLTVAAAVSVLAVATYGVRRAPRGTAGSTRAASSPSTTARPPAPGPSPAGATRSDASKRAVLPAEGRAPSDSPSVADALVEEARAVPRDRVAEAKQLLGDALDADPQNVGALRFLSRIRLDEESFDAAIELANRCLHAEPTNAECTDLRLMALGRSGRGDSDASERAYLEKPDDFGRVQGLAQARLKEGRLADARSLIEKMRALEPESALVPTMAGEAHLREGDARSALADFTAACRLGQEYACTSAAKLRARPKL